MTLYEYNAEVIRRIGPLTFGMDIDLGFNTHIHETVRLDQLKQPTREHRSTVTGFVTQWLTNHPKFVLTSTHAREKYGRTLGILRGEDGAVLNAELVSSGLVEYIDQVPDDETQA